MGVVIAKFPDTELSFVGGSMLGESTARLANLPTCYTNPGAARGGRHGREMGGGTREFGVRHVWNAMPRWAGLVFSHVRPILINLIHRRYVQPIGAVRLNHLACQRVCFLAPTRGVSCLENQSGHILWFEIPRAPSDTGKCRLSVWTGGIHTLSAVKHGAFA